MTVNENTSLSILHDPVARRQYKFDKWRAQGEAYPNDFQRNKFLDDIIQAHHEQNQITLENNPVQVRVAGRVMQRRVMGKISFLDLQDVSARLQIYLREQDVALKTTSSLKDINEGDLVGVEGSVFRTKTGELSIRASKFWLFAKAKCSLPDKFHGLQDVEIRYRQRYLDLIVNPKTREVFKQRARLLKAIREFFDSQNYLEVETPMMQPMAGGALARPFMTHHNALDMPLYLRIAPELYLKRLVIGGFEQVYEINRNFRNEGLSTRHNPEFTMLEFYKAYADYHHAMDITESLIKQVTQVVLGTHAIHYQGEIYDFSKPFKRFTVSEALLYTHPTLNEAIIQDLAQLRQWAKEYHLDTKKSLGELQFSLFEATVEKQLKQPTFITEHPIEVSPLARRKTDNPAVADRFELYIAGRELANGFSELNDPEEQAQRFKAQRAAREGGDHEAMDYDQDYITALEYGLPPTAGVGVGIDRLMMLLADVPSIRDVILFPLMRPVNQG
jgi:lysyl-tRNA synthetase class 2